MDKHGCFHFRTVKEDRLKMVRMWMEGKSVRAISQETGSSLPTVHRWLRRWQREGTVETRTYSVRRHRRTSQSSSLIGDSSKKYNSRLTGKSLPDFHFSAATTNRYHYPLPFALINDNCKNNINALLALTFSDSPSSVVPNPYHCCFPLAYYLSAFNPHWSSYVWG